MSDHRTAGEVVSQLLGWTYFGCWTVSFYPQVLLNFQRKNVVGLSVDFVVLNILGFSFYSIYNILFLSSSEIHREYQRRHPHSDVGPLVQVNDVFFAVHAAVISVITLTQVYCWGYERASRQFPSSWTWGIVAGSCLAVSTLSVMVAASHGTLVEWIDVGYALSYVKLLCTFVKYVPQALLNYRRQSTTGWSIHNILLDFSGGVLSLAQLFLDAFLSNDFSGVVGNPAKLGLSILAMAFDVLFIFQHYVLYRESDIDTAAERRPILDRDEV